MILEIELFYDGNENTNYNEGEDVQGGGDGEDGRVGETVVEHPAGELAKSDAAHGAAESDQAGDFAEGFAGDEVGGKNHDECGPGLLAEKSEAEDRDDRGDVGGGGDEEHPWHESRAEGDGDFAGE